MKNINLFKKILKESYFFNTLTENQLSKIASVSSLITFKKDGIIFSEGDISDGFYLLHKGKVRIYKLSPKGKEQTLNYIAEHEPFGEAAVFMGKNFPAHAQAESDSQVLFIKKDDFIKTVKDNPELSLKLLGVLSQRLKIFASLIESLSLKEVPERVIQYLLELYKKQKTFKLKLPVSKTQLAVTLGTTSETLSRALAKLAKEKIIRVENKYIVILDLKKLEYGI